QKALRLQREGLRIADRLESAANDDPETLAEVDILREGLHDQNIFHAANMSRDDGTLFEGLGVLSSSNSHLDPFYIADKSRRARKRIAPLLTQIQPGRGECWRLVTLTIPTLVGVDLGTVIKVVQAAWSLLRKRKWWIARVRAGVKSVEFTLGDETKLREERRDWNSEKDGYHVHLHLLLLSSWIDGSRLGKEGTDCLRRAGARENVPMEVGTSHGRAVVDVRLVHTRGKR